MDAQFKRTVHRLTAEAIWLHIYQTALERMEGIEHTGLDFFLVAQTSLTDARLLRLIRVLDKNSKTASFWYLRQKNPTLVNGAAKRAGLDLKALDRLATKLVPLRNQTFMHIDREHVSNPEQLYREARITHLQIARAIDGVWKTMEGVHLGVFGAGPSHDEYSGEDIWALAALRDAASA